MVTAETLKSWFEGEDSTVTFGILVLRLFSTDTWFEHRFIARLNLDAYSDREGPILIDLRGTKQGVLEQASQIINQWNPEMVREWAVGLEKLHHMKVERRSAFSRLVEE